MCALIGVVRFSGYGIIVIGGLVVDVNRSEGSITYPRALLCTTTCGALAVLMVLIWMWESDPEPTPAVPIGGGINLPTYVAGPQSHSWLAMVVLLLVAGSLFLAFVFSYLYLWTTAPQHWPQNQDLPLSWLVFASGAMLVLASIAMRAAGYALSTTLRRFALSLLLLVAALALLAALAIDVAGHWQSGLRPSASGYGAMVYLAAILQLQVVAAVLIMALFAGARVLTKQVSEARRVTIDNTGILLHYAVAQGLLGLALVHGFPRLLA